MIASGGNDNKIMLWDDRKLSVPLCKISKVNNYIYMYSYINEIFINIFLISIKLQ
jgi:hypothetical protein